MVGVNFQPTILVKKADGTTERVSLAELKKRQAGSPVSASAAVSAEPVDLAQTTAVSVPVAPTTVKPPVVAPVILPSVPVETKMENKPVFSSVDAKPLLHEEVPESEHAKTTVAANRVDQVSKIIESLSFKVPSQFENRLRSVVQLRLKDIRGEADTIDACARSIKDGGLGLSQAQAVELAQKAKPSAYIPKTNKIESVSLPDNKSTKDDVVDKIIGSATIPSPSIDNLIAGATTVKMSVPANTSPVRASAPADKAMMHDVRHNPQAVGPLEEIQFFTLVDFRRLSAQPAEAALRLKQKFVNLKEESFLLFMKSWEAWRNSPLYQVYVGAVDEAASKKLPLSAVLGEKEKISMSEIEALINLEKDLSI